MTQRALTIEDICTKLRPVYGKKIDDLYLQYAMADSREEKDEMAQVFNALYHKNLSQLLDRNVLLEPPKKELVAGDYPLGLVSYADKKLYDFALREKDFPRHMCISGMSGSGKTTFAFGVLKNFMKKNKPFFVFDWKKSFRPLLVEDKNMMCFTVGDDEVSNVFRTNINRPPKGVNPKEWINVLCDLLTESFSVSFGVHKVLLETLDELYEGWGVYKDAKDYPTWRHVKKRLEEKMADSKGSREGTWLESALRIASVLTFGAFGDVINSEKRETVTVDDLFKSKVIFELSALGNIEKKFFCEFILTYVYKLKKARQNSNYGGFDHAILVDEAHNIFLKDKTSFVNESVTDMVYREMREYGTSLICLDQHISKLSDTVKGNSACHVAFQQQLPDDIYDISNLMQLSDNKEYFSKLTVGSAIVKLAERYTSPFLIEAPFVDVRSKFISNDEIKSRMSCLMDAMSFSKKVDPEFNKSLVNPDYKKADVKIVSASYADETNIEVEVQKVPYSDTIEAGVKPYEHGDVVKRAGEIERNVFTVPNLVAKKVEQEKAREVPVKENVFVVPSLTGVRSSASATPNPVFEKAKEKAVEPVVQVAKNKVDNGLSEVENVLYDFVKERLLLGDDFSEIKNILDSGLFENVYSEVNVMNVVNFAMKEKLRKVEIASAVSEDESESESKFNFEIDSSRIKGISDGLEVARNKDCVSVEHVMEIIENEKMKEKAKSSENIEYSEAPNGVPTRGKEKSLKTLKSSIFKDLSADEISLMEFLVDNPNHEMSTVELYGKVGLSPRRGNNAKKGLLIKGLICVHEDKNEKGWKKYVRVSQELGSYIQVHTA